MKDHQPAVSVKAAGHHKMHLYRMTLQI